MLPQIPYLTNPKKIEQHTKLVVAYDKELDAVTREISKARAKAAPGDFDKTHLGATVGSNCADRGRWGQLAGLARAPRGGPGQAPPGGGGGPGRAGPGRASGVGVGGAS